MVGIQCKKSSIISNTEPHGEMLPSINEKAGISQATETSNIRRFNQTASSFIPFVTERDTLGRLVSQASVTSNPMELSKQDLKKKRSIKMGSSRGSQSFKYRPTLAEIAKGNLQKMKEALNGRNSPFMRNWKHFDQPNSFFRSQRSRDSFSSFLKDNYPPIGIYKPNYGFIQRKEPVVKFDHFSKPDPFFENLRRAQDGAEKARREDTKDIRSIYIKYYGKKCQVAVMDKKSTKNQIQAQRVDERSIQRMKQYFESNDVQHLKGEFPFSTRPWIVIVKAEKYPGFDESRIPKPLGNDKMEDRRDELL